MTTPIEVTQPTNQTQLDAGFDGSCDSTVEPLEMTDDTLPSEMRSLLSLEYDRQTMQDYHQICGRW